MIGKTICHLCELFEWSETGQVCSAFPAGIPPEILHRGFDHRNEFPGGDNGVRFVPRKGVTPEQVDQLVAESTEVPVPGV